MARNFELKARVADLASARETALRLAPLAARERQTDTYFPVPHGRLKLREIEGETAQLVWYARADQAAPRASDYTLVPVPDPAALKGALEAALGVRCVVCKRREIYLWKNVRIHLDDVNDLGSFVEFEAIVVPQMDERRAAERVHELATRFALDPNDWVDRSYSDLLAEPE